MIHFLLFALCTCFSTVSPTASNTCIENYYELKSSIVNISENAQNLLTTFYPPNKPPAHIIIVYCYLAYSYHDRHDTGNITGNETHPNFENPNITADHMFQWLDSSTLLLTEFRLFKALTFGIAGLESTELEIKVDKPFCDPNDEVTLLNLATIWLKTYTVHDKSTEYYYSMYFDGEKFIVLGNSVRDSTFALVLCEYFACTGALVVIYTMLVLCKYETFAPFRKALSSVSIPCFVFSLAIVIKDIHSYSVSFQYVSTEWYRAFPIPVIVPLFAVFNTFVSIVITAIIGPKFQIPPILSTFASVMCLKGKFYNSIMQVLLIFSIALFAVLATFHFAWVVLAFSSYPVRCLASQAFTIPFY